MNTERYSPWVRWADRNKLQDLNFPGVYALAISKDDDVSGKPFSWIKAVVYFGMTNAVRGLKGRIEQFNDTIIGKSTAHGGAERFLYDYPREQDLVPFLYVSVAPFKCSVTSIKYDDLITMGDVAKAEYECFAEYADRFGKLPHYNNKKKAPKGKRNAGPIA
jgi:hypothetical protein